MTRIFISYRRADSAFATDSIYEHMCRHFGEDNVFLDVGSIPIGVDFREYLQEQIAAHDVVLVIIGPDWGRLMAERASAPNDFVRIEIENALNMHKLVIPVLVMDSEMPDFSSLPDSIQDLQWRNSARVRRLPYLRDDCQHIADGINGYFATTHSLQEQPPTPAPTKQLLHSLVYDVLPAPFEWIEVPVGKVTLEDHDGFYGGGKTFNVPAFFIAKYPITNAQFAKFVEADGYQTQQWWTDSGWQHRIKNNWINPRYWHDQKWNGANFPVVGVSWYEAIAFCRWLRYTTEEQVILPTEQEWQRAAQGNDERTYPWGNTWDTSRSNFRNQGHTTPVTHYVSGASPFGIMDMSGNVWEWCLSIKETEKTDIDLPDARILRGGGFNAPVGITARDWDFPYSRDYDFGFRICKPAT